MDKIERVKMVKAMEFICRQLNDERDMMSWLTYGVADGDIEYGDLSVAENVEDDEAAWYVDDDEGFAELMREFLCVMRSAANDGGLYCDGVIDKTKGDD